MTKFVKNKKIVFCDVDGTLLDGPHGLVRLPEETVRALQKLLRNHYLIISSGRTMSLIGEDIRKLNPSGYCLGNGGYLSFQNQVIDKHPFLKESIIEMTDFCHSHHGICMLETQHDIFSYQFNRPVFENFRKNWNMPELEVVERPMEKDEEVYKITTAFETDADALAFEEQFKSQYEVKRQIVMNSFDVTPKGISKGTAVSCLLKYLNIQKEDAYCFGDGDNDLDMFKAVRHPIAMQNASDYLKANAEFVCESVLEQGVYKQLERLKLIEND